MPLEIVTIPCLNDNYAYLLHDDDTGATAVVDVPEAGPIQRELAVRGWILSDILITHHHHDHIGGVDTLRGPEVRVVGGKADRHRLPNLDLEVEEGDSVFVGSAEGEILDVSGHTVGHIAFHFPAAPAVFTADSLMALGCGRLFEGTADQMWTSLSKLAALPPETLICSGHEYTQANARFAITVDPNNADLTARIEDVHKKRAENQPTVPSTLADELGTNPFLRVDNPAIRSHLNMETATNTEVFAHIRGLKDAF
ncbi:hydroxyacylglutathione hydrolase [Actibacterium sp. 188UL27-1]|uniref:hydroxyacylglutathione hydrolase n=1 Tax=Actibacterium sp. 188UL27-1 TaxID=2786961 RepID=UPI00195A4E15|nr:hydroxyacylglutathione hydrolase [Actibacterium sp. 188UL27-1]MBM7066086.1 hydroxyacylglutathione hydrolase [Actibacterium sp. 188UL27-1]